MINTRRTIFKTLLKRIRELTKHAQLAPKDFKKIIIAVILNDLKEWSEYIPKDDSDKIVDLLDNYLINNCFLIDRIPVNDLSYVNVNTPQNNNTWSRIWDKLCSLTYIPIKVETCDPWDIDPTCDIQVIYFYPVDSDNNPIDPLTYLKLTYGECGLNLKTICEKMNIYKDPTSGKYFYLDNSTCKWKEIESSSPGITEDRVKEIISGYKIDNQWNSDNEVLQKIQETSESGIKFATSDDESIDDII